MFSDHYMGPAGGSGHPWGVPYGSHAVIYGLLFDVATDLYVKMAQNDPKWPKIGRNRQQKNNNFEKCFSIEIAAVLGAQPSDRVVEPYWVGHSLIPRSEGRASETPPPAWF